MSVRRTALAVLAATLLCALPVRGDRSPVLSQIDVPHPYYFREMYLPQVTSGPQWPAWSPDGRELVYAMQGTLWRQHVDGTSARQLTDGPGYDSQPDWSPDGRFVAYVSYTGGASSLRLLELATGRTSDLTTGSAVDVEPRWSPDGSRIVFVSTRDHGRWHLFTMAVADGRAGAIEQLTAEHDSGLPRYYYSRFDHEISPSWSPDGREVVFVSNRGHIWGSGGMWRMEARPGAAAREIRAEETTWRARPDWARDGRRVAYASYSGGQWHQIWLTTAEGGDPLPLTYGDWDVTEPRWSPDGRRLACVSNEGGDTALLVIDVPGGEQHRVTAVEQRALGPVGRLRISVADATGPVPARVSVTTADGRSWTPRDAWRHADDAFDRASRRFEYSYFHTPGSSELTVPAGHVSIEVTRGLEYGVWRAEADVPGGGTRDVSVRLERLDDLPARGVWSGDLHVHMNYAGTYRNDPAHLVLQARAEDLHVVESLIVNKEQRVPDVARRLGQDAASTADTLVVHGQEYHTSFWGHTGLLGMHGHLLLPGYAGYVNTAAASLVPTNTQIAALAHAQGGLFGYVHPFDAPPDPARADEALTHGLPVDAALGVLDYLEVVGFSDHRATAGVWHRLLSCGFRIPAGAGTDAMADYASLRGPVGMNRVFVQAGPRLDHAAFLSGLQAGRTFATNGPLLSLTLGGHGPGDDVALARPGALEAVVRLRSIVPVERLELVGNGTVVASFDLGPDRTRGDFTRSIAVPASGWYTLQAWSAHAAHPVLDIYPFATTSPVYVTVAGEPVRSRSDAEFFEAWIDRLAAAAAAHPGWNTALEKQEVLAALARARAVYAQRAAEGR